MKQLLLFAFCASSFASSVSYQNESAIPDKISSNTNTPNPNGNKMKIKIGDYTFTAMLYDNATATAFKSLLPISVKMVELNGNEKYVDLPSNLPANASNPGSIQTGDLMLYTSSTLVLFYRTFSTSYSYTRLGRIDNITGLAAAVGSEDVTVTFALE